MSQVAVAEFMNAASSNPSLLSEVANAGQGRSESEAGELIAALGREAGYLFSAADALAFREIALAKLIAGSVDVEDDVLEGVRGGSGSSIRGGNSIQTGSSISSNGSYTPSPQSSIWDAFTATLGAGAAQGNHGGSTQANVGPNDPLVNDLVNQVNSTLQQATNNANEAYIAMHGW